MKLSKEQTDALKKSVKKWELIVDGKASDKGEDNCECCNLYAKDYGCPSCPVAIEADRDGCDGTPWILWNDYQQESDRHWWSGGGTKVFDDHSKQLAQAELDFLKGILEESTLKG